MLFCGKYGQLDNGAGSEHNVRFEKKPSNNGKLLEKIETNKEKLKNRSASEKY